MKCPVKKAQASWSNSFQVKLFSRLSLVIICVILSAMVILYCTIRTHMQDNQILVQREAMESRLMNLDYYFMNLMSKTDMLFMNDSLSKLLEDHNDDLYNKINTSNQIKSFIDKVLFDLKYPEIKTSYYFGGQVNTCIYVKNSSILADGINIDRYDNIISEEFAHQLLHERRTFSWNIGNSAQLGSYLAFNRRILSLQTLQDIAILQLQVSLSKIASVLQQSIDGSSSFYYYIDPNDNIIINNGDESICSHILEHPELSGTVTSLAGEEGDYVVDVVQSELNGFRLVYATSMDPVYRSIQFITPLMFGTSIVAIILCALFFLAISKHSLRGIRQLIDKTKQMPEVNLSDYALLGHIQSSNEIMQLDDAFTEMVSTIDKLHKKETQYQTIINEVRAELLQEQFNPHLLYNTLSMIRYMEQEKGDRELFSVIDNLISFYKRVLNHGQIVSTIRDEVAIIGYYIQVVKKVYNPNIIVKIDVDENVMEYYTIKMFLQPIIENSMVHGLQQMKQGTLLISGKKLGNMLQFVVSDDGIGMPKNVVKEIMQIISGNSSTTVFKSYGYESIAKRLYLFYGKQYSMHIDSTPGEGTTVEMTIPALHEDEIKSILLKKGI